MTRHKHADVIHAWADGAEIQAFYGGKWWDEPIPCFFPENEYRIKPRTVKHEGWVNIYRERSVGGPAIICRVHPTEEAAKTCAQIGTVARVRVEWEEEE